MNRTRLRIVHSSSGPEPDCCVEGVCTPATCTQLPEGETCATCLWIATCEEDGASVPSSTRCEYFPRKFLRNGELRIVP